ncbi:MAG: DUF6164 family protein [Gammaproteobacteria bacterium]
MSVQLFRLKNVSDDEADDIRTLLTNNHIDFYETPPGNWGISMPAIWLHDDEKLARAKDLIDSYQQERKVNIRKEYDQLKKNGQQQSFLTELFRNPLQLIIYVAIAALVFYLSIKPFLSFGQ